MLKFKSYFFLLILIGLTACKSSPTADTDLYCIGELA